MNKLENEIEKALRKSTKGFLLSEEFTGNLLRKIQARELLKIRFGWLHLTVISFFTVFTALVLLIFIGEAFAELVEQSAIWLVMISALIVLFQLIDHKLIRKQT